MKTESKIDEKIKQELEEIYLFYFNDERIKSMRNIPMHFGSNCYFHSFKVAKYAIKVAIKREGYNLKDLLVASILHDYYLYDWRKDKEKKKKHGKNHPKIAAENAKRDFGISDSVVEIMIAHMWPLTPKNYPKSKEAKLLNRADNVIATREFLSNTKHKKKKEQEI